MQMHHSYFLLPRSLPIRPTRPASRVTRLGLPTSGADESIQEEGSAACIHTRPVNGSSATLTNLPRHGIYALRQPAHEAGLSIEKGWANPDLPGKMAVKTTFVCLFIFIRY